MKQSNRSRANGKLYGIIAVLEMRNKELENEVDLWRSKCQWKSNSYHRAEKDLIRKIKQLTLENEHYRAFIQEVANLPYIPLVTTLDIKRKAKKLLR